MIRYILALIPPPEQAPIYIQTAQKLFSASSEGYLLSENSSPHITLCQFECDREQTELTVWEEIKKLNLNSSSVRFTGISFLKGVGEHNDFYWAEIAIGRDEEILSLHHTAVKIIQSQGLHSLNDSGALYRPHLTLARIRLPHVIQKWPDEILQNKHPFKIALAKGDHNGQYLSTLFGN